MSGNDRRGDPPRSESRSAAGARTPVGRRRIAAAVALLVAATVGCAEEREARPKKTALAHFDFEQAGWGGRGDWVVGKAHTGQGACQVETGGPNVAAWSPPVPLRGATRLRLTFWTWAEELESDGKVALRVHGMTDEPPEHPAMPPVPRPVGEKAVLLIDKPEAGWTRHKANLSITNQFPAGTTSVRFEFQIDGRFGNAARALLDDLDVVGMVPVE